MALIRPKALTIIAIVAILHITGENNNSPTSTQTDYIATSLHLAPKSVFQVDRFFRVLEWHYGQKKAGAWKARYHYQLQKTLHTVQTNTLNSFFKLPYDIGLIFVKNALSTGKIYDIQEALLAYQAYTPQKRNTILNAIHHCVAILGPRSKDILHSYFARTKFKHIPFWYSISNQTIARTKTWLGYDLFAEAFHNWNTSYLDKFLVAYQENPNTADLLLDLAGEKLLRNTIRTTIEYYKTPSRQTRRKTSFLGALIDVLGDKSKTHTLLTFYQKHLLIMTRIVKSKEFGPELMWKLLLNTSKVSYPDLEITWTELEHLKLYLEQVFGKKKRNTFLKDYLLYYQPRADILIQQLYKDLPFLDGLSEINIMEFILLYEKINRGSSLNFSDMRIPPTLKRAFQHNIPKQQHQHIREQIQLILQTNPDIGLFELIIESLAHPIASLDTGLAAVLRFAINKEAHLAHLIWTDTGITAILEEIIHYKYLTSPTTSSTKKIKKKTAGTLPSGKHLVPLIQHLSHLYRNQPNFNPGILLKLTTKAQSSGYVFKPEQKHALVSYVISATLARYHYPLFANYVIEWEEHINSISHLGKSFRTQLNECILKDYTDTEIRQLLNVTDFLHILDTEQNPTALCLAANKAGLFPGIHRVEKALLELLSKPRWSKNLDVTSRVLGTLATTSHDLDILNEAYSKALHFPNIPYLCLPSTLPQDLKKENKLYNELTIECTV